MDLEKIYEEAVDEDDSEKLELFLKLLMDRWVYFFLLETGGEDTPVSTANVTYIMTTGKDNPINIPTINNENGSHGVIYTNSDLAVKSAEMKYKVGKMKGIRAFEMFRDISSVDAVYVQSATCHVRIPQNEIKRLIAANT